VPEPRLSMIDERIRTIEASPSSISSDENSPMQFRKNQRYNKKMHYLDTGVAHNRFTTSAPASRKTSRKEILDYIYNHENVPERSEIMPTPTPLNYQEEDRSLNSLLLRAKLELEQEMERRKAGQVHRLHGYAANNSRALMRRRSSDNLYVLMSADENTDQVILTDQLEEDADIIMDQAQEITEDFVGDCDEVFEHSLEDDCTNTTQRMCMSNSIPTPVMCDSMQTFSSTNHGIFTPDSKQKSCNNNQANFPNSNIEIRVQSEDDWECSPRSHSLDLYEDRSISGAALSIQTSRTRSLTSSSKTGLDHCWHQPSKSLDEEFLVGSPKIEKSILEQSLHVNSFSSESMGSQKCLKGKAVYPDDYLPMDIGLKFKK